MAGGKKPNLTLKRLCKEAAAFSIAESKHQEPSIYATTDGKALGTYLEHKFRDYLYCRFDFKRGSSARGIDFPRLNVDMKVTSAKQPQSSSPFKSARQKIYGLGYSLLVFVYDKIDDHSRKTGCLKILHTVYINRDLTGDYQTTTGILKLINNNANVDDLTAFIFERNLPVDEVHAEGLAEEILTNPPTAGYLTISNALQWRLQYRRVIDEAGHVKGIERLI